MYLINTDTLQLKEFIGKNTPKYAILSHTWEDEEISFQEILHPTDEVKLKRGYQKVLHTALLAKEEGLQWCWVDTCCIDKKSSAELSEAINSMFRWYRRAKVCYVYLADVHPLSEPDKLHVANVLDSYMAQRTIKAQSSTAWLEGSILHASFIDWLRDLQCSRWFTRGWTLQELLAPVNVAFYSRNWTFIGYKHEAWLQRCISTITGIRRDILANELDVNYASIAEKMSWAAHRETSRTEDIAYCLLGLLRVNLPLLYGEGRQAFERLQMEVIRAGGDHSVLLWASTDATDNELFAARWAPGRISLQQGLLAQHPKDFAKLASYFGAGRAQYRSPTSDLQIINRDICLRAPLIPVKAEHFESPDESFIELKYMNDAVNGNPNTRHFILPLTDWSEPDSLKASILVHQLDDERYYRVSRTQLVTVAMHPITLIMIKRLPLQQVRVFQFRPDSDEDSD